MKRIILVAGLLVGAVAAAGVGIIHNNKLGRADKSATKAEAAVAPVVAAVDVAYNAKGEPIAARPVVLTTDNQIVGYAEPHPLSQIGEAHTFVKGAPAEQNFLGGVTTSRLLIGQFTCVDRGGIRMVRLDSKVDGFRKELIFIADDYTTSMAFANELQAATTDQPQFVLYGGDGGCTGHRVNYNLSCIHDKMWLEYTSPMKVRYLNGSKTDSILTQAALVGWEVNGGATAGNGGQWQVQIGVNKKF